MNFKMQNANFKLAALVALRCEQVALMDAPVLRAREFANDVVTRTGVSDAGVIMYAPGGKHTITPAADQGSAEVTLLIDDTTAAVLNASLRLQNARMAPQRCFIDKNHEGKEATAWPKEFFWSESSPDGAKAPGVYCRVEYSALGRGMVEGKVLRAFSPSIYSDAELPKKIKAGQHVVVSAGKRGSAENPARIVGLVAPDIGTLTNDPAFKNILPLFAQNANGGQSNKPAAGAAARETGKTNMKKTDQELLTLRARKTELEQALPGLKAKDMTDATVIGEIQNAEHELNSINATLQAHDMAVKNEELTAALMAQRKKDAQAAVAAAVKRGAIPPKNVELQQHWENRLVEDPSNLVLLQAMNGAAALQNNANPAGQPRIIINPSGAQELRASNRAVLMQLAQHIEAGDHREVSALYAREVRPRMTEGDDIALRAADVADANVGTVAGTLVAIRTLELFRLQFDGILNAISTDFSDAAADFGGRTMTRIVVVPAVISYDATLVNGEPVGWVITTPAQTVDVPVDLDQHKGVQITFGTNLLASTARRLFDEQAPAAAYALTKDMIDALYAKITRGNFNDYAGNANLGGVNGYATVPEVDFGRRTFGIAGRIFNPAGVPMDNRFALLNSDYHDALEQDPTITNLAVQQASREGVITQGSLPPIKKFKPFEAPNLPVTNNLAAFFGHKSSLLIKSRLPSDYTSILPAGASHGKTQVVTDPDTGLSAFIVWFANHSKGSANFRIAWMFGTAKGYTKGGLRLESQ